MSLNSIIFIIATILIFIGFVTTVAPRLNYARRKAMGYDDPAPKRSKAACGILILGILLVVASNAFRVIPTGYTGVRTTFGLIDRESAMPGMNLTIPFVQRIDLVNNKQQDIRFTDQIWSETKEQTPVYMQNVTVTYQIIPESSAWIYANVENWVEELVDFDLVSSALKTASRQLSGDDVTDRGRIEPNSMKTLQSAIDEKYGENRVEVKNLVIGNMDFDESYNQAIAKKSEALQKQQEQAITNKTNVDKAKAEAQAEMELANGRAQAVLIEAEAKAEANRKIADSLTPATQRQDAIDKWNGVLPQAAADNVSFGILDIASGALPATGAD